MGPGYSMVCSPGSSEQEGGKSKRQSRVVKSRGSSSNPDSHFPTSRLQAGYFTPLSLNFPISKVDDNTLPYAFKRGLNKIVYEK